MDLAQFRQSLEAASPPPGLQGPLAALWHLAKNDWQRAHELAQASDGKDGAWVHAHLHRVEGDAGNAAYWYRRAGRVAAGGPLDAEWDAIAAALLAASPR